MRLFLVTPVTAILLAGSMLGATHMVAQTTPAVPDLTGAWKLNKNLSDDPQTVLAEDSAPAADPRPDDGGRRGATGSRSRWDRSGTSGNSWAAGGLTDSARRRVRETVRAVFQTPDRLTIVRIGGTMSLTDGDGRVTNLFTGGEEEVHTVGPNIEVGTKAHWNAGTLVVEVQTGAKTPVTQTYSVSATDGKRQLRIAMSMEDDRTQKTVQLTRVYDLAEY
jgi:hypothetical protein